MNEETYIFEVPRIESSWYNSRENFSNSEDLWTHEIDPSKFALSDDGFLILPEDDNPPKWQYLYEAWIVIHYAKRIDDDQILDKIRKSSAFLRKVLIRKYQAFCSTAFFIYVIQNEKQNSIAEMSAFVERYNASMRLFQMKYKAKDVPEQIELDNPYHFLIETLSQNLKFFSKWNDELIIKCLQHPEEEWKKNLPSLARCTKKINERKCFALSKNDSDFFFAVSGEYESCGDKVSVEIEKYIKGFFPSCCNIMRIKIDDYDVQYYITREKVLNYSEIKKVAEEMFVKKWRDWVRLFSCSERKIYSYLQSIKYYDVDLFILWPSCYMCRDVVSYNPDLKKIKQHSIEIKNGNASRNYFNPIAEVLLNKQEKKKYLKG